MGRGSAIARAILLVAVALGMLSSASALPLTKPTARPGACLRTMLGEIQAQDKARKGYGLIFYGDSIFESLRGTDKCRSCNRLTVRSSCEGVPAVLTKAFGAYRPGVMAMAMDETAHLLWRLQNGAIPTRNLPRVAVLLIGTNDLTNTAWSASVQGVKERALAKQVPRIAGRIQVAADLLRQKLPRTRVLLLGLLPRGTGTGKGLPSADNDFSWPSHYAKAIAAVNKQLKGYARTSAGAVSFLDCGKVFLVPGGIKPALMADALHPTAAGWTKLAACMLPHVKKLY